MGGQGTILLQWIGEGPMGQDLLERVRRQVEAAFDIPTYLGVANGPPPETLDLRRGQRSSTRILRWLLTTRPPRGGKILGITDTDLFIPVLTFVFGEAQVDGPAAVVSMARLRLTYDERPAPLGLLEARLSKECLHELGHTFGLVHCPDVGCVMSRSNSVLDVDQKRAGFCRDCRQRLRALTEETEERDDS
ncbi:MAG: archaemetzincin family Zn-dependent metalloprotease [candidate division NC10 bacterium]|nr:archaemetzincin family Zn-dependent metalloprotease [candidate division NC10 bacterium]